MLYSVFPWRLWCLTNCDVWTQNLYDRVILFKYFLLDTFKLYSIRSIEVESHFVILVCSIVDESFSVLVKVNTFLVTLLYSLVFYSLFIFLLFSFPTLFLLYLTHLTQFFLISVMKINVSTTMEHIEYEWSIYPFLFLSPRLIPVTIYWTLMSLAIKVWS